MKQTIGIIMSISLMLIATWALVFADDEQHWGFKKARDEQQIDIPVQLSKVLKKYDAIYRGDTKQKVLYLTFDNGYENGYTESILNTLQAENVPATFFLTGHYVTSASDLVKRMVEDGHTIGNHSDKHPNMAKLTEQQILAEWQSFDMKLQQVTGLERTYVARPPEGIYNEQLLAVGAKHDYRHIFWSVAFKDWEKDVVRGADYAYNELITQMHPGAIILMHTVAQDNAEALPLFIKEAKKRGYTFGSIQDI